MVFMPRSVRGIGIALVLGVAAGIPNTELGSSGNAGHGRRKLGSAHATERGAAESRLAGGIERVNEYLARMHALSGLSLFLPGGAGIERLRCFAPFACSPNAYSASSACRPGRCHRAAWRHLESHPR